MPFREALLDAHWFQIRRRETMLGRAGTAQKSRLLAVSGIDDLKAHAVVVSDPKLQYDGFIKPDWVLICTRYAEHGNQNAVFLHHPVRKPELTEQVNPGFS